MKKIVFTLITLSALMLAGCIENTEEVTLNDNGGGTINITNDFSSILGTLKMMGGSDQEKMEEANKDTTIQLSTVIDSVKSLSAEEKAVLRSGTLHYNVNIKDEKGALKLTYPFKKLSDIAIVRQSNSRLMSEAIKIILGGGDDAPGMDQLGEPSSLDSYYDVSYSNDEIKRKVNKEKYANAESDQYLAQMKQAGAMGITITSTQVINLPRPAKEVEGKNVKLSDDKKKVTVTASIDDFFSDPSAMEFKIKY